VERVSIELGAPDRIEQLTFVGQQLRTLPVTSVSRSPARNAPDGLFSCIALFAGHVVAILLHPLLDRMAGRHASRNADHQKALRGAGLERRPETLVCISVPTPYTARIHTDLASPLNAGAIRDRRG
jgi:hypothetical protein